MEKERGSGSGEGRTMALNQVSLLSFDQRRRDQEEEEERGGNETRQTSFLSSFLLTQPYQVLESIVQGYFRGDR